MRLLLTICQVGLLVMALLGAVVVSLGQTPSWERQEARLDALHGRITSLEELKIADRLARVEEGQNTMRQLQWATLGSILSLALETLARRLKR